jgi:hypothetical protein
MQVDRYVAERRRKQKTRRKYVWGSAGFLAIYFLMLGVFYLVVESPAFQVKKIVIVGASTVPTSTVMDLALASVTNRDLELGGAHDGLRALLGFHNMFLWPDALPAGTIAAVPRLAGVTISKDYFLHTITITVTERAPFAVWCAMPAAGAAAGDASSSEQCYWFDSRGVAFARTFDTQGGAILVLHDYANDPVALGKAILPVEFMPNLISIVNVLKESSLDVSELTLRDVSLQQVDATTADGPVIHFSLRFLADPDLAVLQSIMAKPDFKKLEYIDFTVKGRAYYR